MSDAAQEGPGIRNTRILGREEIMTALQDVVRIGAEASGATCIGLQFGWSWALELDLWKVRTVTWEEVMPALLEVELAGHGKLGDNDLSLHIGPDIIEFCHHGDIHLPADPVTPGGIAICRHLSSLLPATA